MSAAKVETKLSFTYKTRESTFRQGSESFRKLFQNFNFRINIGTCCGIKDLLKLQFFNTCKQPLFIFFYSLFVMNEKVDDLIKLSAWNMYANKCS